MKTFGVLLKNELKLNIRNMNMVIFAILMPLVVLLILGIICGTKPLEGRAIITLSLPMDEIGIFLNMDSPDYERLKKNIEDSLNG